MEKIQLKYSYKNIPIPSERTYKLQLVEKIEMLIKRMRWKAHFFELNKDKDAADNEQEEIPNNYGLKSFHCPPQVKELTDFENELFDLVNAVKFRKTQNQFQKTLKEDMITIKNTPTTLTFADKTTNMYKLTKEEHNKLLTDAVTSTYKKAEANVESKIMSEGKKLVKNKSVYNRMLTNGKNEAFITLKDHKPNFQNNPSLYSF